MHRPGRIGRNVFDIDLFGRTGRALAVGLALAQHRAKFLRPRRRLQGQIDEAGTGDIDRGDEIIGAQLFRDPVGEVARLGLCLLGEHHRGIGRHVAVRGVARRLDHDARKINARGPIAFAGKRRAYGVDARQNGSKKMR